MLTGSIAARPREAGTRARSLRVELATGRSLIVFIAVLIAPLTSNAAFSLVPNGSFEQELSHWTIDPLPQSNGTAAITPDSQHVRHGAISLRLDVVGPASAGVQTAAIPIEAGANYLLSFLYRAEGFSSDGTAQGVSSAVSVRWLDADGANVSELRIGMPYGSEPWGHMLRLVTPPFEADAVSLSIQLSASPGTLPSSVWIDDVRLRPWVTERLENVETRSWNIAAGRQHSLQYRVVADDDTAAKTSVLANPTYHTPGLHLVNDGIVETKLAPGAYRVDFRMKVSSNTSSAPLATSRVVSGSALNFTVASSTVAASDFDQALTYQEISLPFIRPAEGYVSPQLIWEGGSAAWIDTLTIVPERLSNAKKFADLFGPREIPAADKTEPPDAPTVTIDSVRYLRTPAPPGKFGLRPKPKTYLSTSWRFHREFSVPRQTWLKAEHPYPNLDANLQVAFFFAFIRTISGSRADGNLAREFISEAHRLRNDGYNQQSSAVIHIGRIWRMLEERSALGNRAREQLIELLVALVPRFPAEKVEYGNSNRPFGKALVGEILLAYVPDAPDAALWREYIETVWNGFQYAKDTRENAGNYNALAFSYLIDWVEQRGAQEEFYSDPAIHTLFERYMLQVLPIGSLPHYGDTTGWNVEWGHWIHIMEAAAAGTGDMRFRWAAQRLFEYGVSRIENLHSWSYTGTAAIESIMLAHQASRGSGAPVPQTEDVVAVDRLRIDPLPPETPKNHGLFSVHPTLRAPSKIVMRSGDSPESTALLLELDRSAGHGPPTAPALLALVDRGAVLLMDQGYKEKGADFHNMLWLEDYVGIPLHEEAEQIQIVETANTGSLRYAKVRVDRYRGYPVELERTVVLAREGPALVVDTLLFEEAFSARLGQVFNLGVVGPEIGETWVNGYIGDFVPVRGIGANTPVYTRWANPLRDLLVYFVPQADATLDLFDRRPQDATNPLPVRVRYTHRSDVTAGSQLAFASVLLPHAPLRYPSELADTVRVEQHDHESTSVSAAQLHDGSRVWLSSGRVDSPGMLTDSDAAVAIAFDGEVVAGGLAGGSYLRLAGSSAQLLTDGTLATAIRRYNAGAGSFGDSLGAFWRPEAGFVGGRSVQSSEPVGGTSNPYLYETQHSAAPDEDTLRFSLSLRDGEYVVRLHFAAIDGGPGQCVFDIALQGEVVRVNVDVASEAGPFTAWSTDLEITVTDRRLDVELLRRIGDPKVSGIEILKRH